MSLKRSNSSDSSLSGVKPACLHVLNPPVNHGLVFHLAVLPWKAGWRSRARRGKVVGKSAGNISVLCTPRATCIRYCFSFFSFFFGGVFLALILTSGFVCMMFQKVRIWALGISYTTSLILHQLSPEEWSTWLMLPKWLFTSRTPRLTVSFKLLQPIARTICKQLQRRIYKTG